MSKQLSILIFSHTDLTEKHLEVLQDIAPEAQIELIDKDTLTNNKLKNTDVIFGWAGNEEIRKAENLKWLHLPSAGANNYLDKDLYQNSNIILTNSSGVYGTPISEHILSMILAFNRKLPLYLKNQKVNKWERSNGHRVIANSTFGIIGLGDIGNETAKKASNWGAKVLAIKKNVTEKPDYVDELYDNHGLDQVLQRSDYIIITLPLTSETRELITEAKFKLMKTESFIVNIGRGAIIDQEALIKALQHGWIAGAGLDVTDPEPLPEDSPLWGFSNVIITPHVSGTSSYNGEERFEIFRKNLELFVDDKPLINRVSFEKEY